MKNKFYCPKVRIFCAKSMEIFLRDLIFLLYTVIVRISSFGIHECTVTLLYETEFYKNFQKL